MRRLGEQRGHRRRRGGPVTDSGEEGDVEEAEGGGDTVEQGDGDGRMEEQDSVDDLLESSEDYNIIRRV